MNQINTEFEAGIMNETTVSQNDDHEIKMILRKISYSGKDEKFVNDPININRYKMLITMAKEAETFYSQTPFIRKTGQLYAQDLSKIYREVVFTVGKKVLRSNRKSVDPDFSCVNFSQLIKGEKGSITGNKGVDINFWKSSSEELTIAEGTESITFLRIAIFNEIRKMERKLRIKGTFKLTFTQLPCGYKIAEGTLNYGDWKTMRSWGVSFRGEVPYMNLSNGDICSKNTRISSGSANKILNVPLKAKINPKDIKYLYGECNYQVIADLEHNLTFMIITNHKGRVITLYHYQKCIQGIDHYLEIDFSASFESFYKKPDILDVIANTNIDVNRYPSCLSLKSSDLTIRPYIVTKNKENKKTKKIRFKQKLIMQMVTPLDKNGCCPTLLAGHAKPSQNNMLSTGHRPNPGVFEIWDFGTNSVKRKLTTFERIAQSSYLISRKYENYNPRYTKDLHFLKNRKISNSGLAVIIKAIQNMKQTHYVKLRSLTPREKFRLMGMEETDITKLLESGIPKENLNKMAGDSVVVNVWTTVLNPVLAKEVSASEVKMAA